MRAAGCVHLTSSPFLVGQVPGPGRRPSSWLRDITVHLLLLASYKCLWEERNSDPSLSLWEAWSLSALFLNGLQWESEAEWLLVSVRQPRENRDLRGRHHLKPTAAMFSKLWDLPYVKSFYPEPEGMSRQDSQYFWLPGRSLLAHSLVIICLLGARGADCRCTRGSQ